MDIVIIVIVFVLFAAFLNKVSDTSKATYVTRNRFSDPADWGSIGEE